MKVALVHDWLTGMRGGERVLEALCGMFPNAPVFTLLKRPDWRPKFLEGHEVHTSFLQRLPGIMSHYRYYLPLFPRAIEQFRFEGFDGVVSSSHCVAKGVRLPPSTRHLSYIHSPMRYMWDQFDEYFSPGRSSMVTRLAAASMRPALQRWDLQSARGVTVFLANSHYTAERVQKLYGRHADVVSPPVEVDRFSVSYRDDGFYLIVSALAPYKQVEVAVEAFRRMGRPLKIIGEGPDRRRLERLGGGQGLLRRSRYEGQVEFLGWQPDEVVREYYARCRALIFPGVEDFGIVPVEAMASGKAVIALGKGGVTDTVVPFDPLRPFDRLRAGFRSGHASTGSGQASAQGRPFDQVNGEAFPTGVWFSSPTPEDLMGAVMTFEEHRRDFDPEKIRAHTHQFRPAVFRERVQKAIQNMFSTLRPDKTHA